jgi:C4-dicarboxylate-specific signal transduction histidine kinase
LTVLAIVRHELRKHGVELRTELDESLPALEGDRVQLQQVVLNSVMNAIETMQSVAPLVLSIRSCVSKPNFVQVAVEDTGTGVDVVFGRRGESIGHELPQLQRRDRVQ